MRTSLVGIFGSTFQVRPQLVSISDIKRSQWRRRYLGLLFVSSLALFAAACGGGSSDGGSGSGSSDGTSGASSGTGTAVVPTPVTTLTEVFSKTADNYVAGAVSSFGFTLASSVDSSTFACSLSNGGVVTAPACTSSYTASVTAPAVGAATTYSLTPTATSPAGKVEASPVTYTWIQQNYKTLALYHLNGTSGSGYLDDSSSFATTLKNPLTEGATATAADASVSGQFSEGRTFTNTKYLSAANSATLNLMSSATVLTVELWVKFASTDPLASGKMILISKTGSSAGTLGWELSVGKGVSNYVLHFVGSGGTTVFAVDSSSIGSTLSTSAYKHVAMIFTKGVTTGSVTLYFDGNRVLNASDTTGVASLGVASASSLLIGRSAWNNAVADTNDGNAASNWFAGSMDEVRISQTATTIYSGTPISPSGPFTAD